MDVHLFHETGCRLVHKYKKKCTKTHFPIRRSRGGGVINWLLALVGRTMAISQLTHLHISIPASGAPPGEVPAFQGAGGPRRVSFASGVTFLGGEPTLEQSPDQVSVHRQDIQIHDPVCPDIPEEGDMDISIVKLDVPIPVLRPHRGFCIFHGRGRSGDRTVIRLCLTFRRSSLADFLGDIGDSRLIHRRCRFSQLFRKTWTTQLLPMWGHPGMSRILHPKLITCQRLLWRIFRSRWIPCRTSLRTPRLPMCSARYRCHLLKLHLISRTV